jgi:hypothetical protein
MQERSMTMPNLKWRIYPTHRVAFYQGWMIVQDPEFGIYYLYLPADDFDDEDVISDLDTIAGLYDHEWDADNLQAAIDFIDGYGEDEND